MLFVLLVFTAFLGRMSYCAENLGILDVDVGETSTILMGANFQSRFHTKFHVFIMKTRENGYPGSYPAINHLGSKLRKLIEEIRLSGEHKDYRF